MEIRKETVAPYIDSALTFEELQAVLDSREIDITTLEEESLENASYLRLKNFTVSYDLSDVIRKCAHLQERNSMMSVYLSGENLFTITNYSGMDPETGGWDALKYPVSRVFSVGVKLTY